MSAVEIKHTKLFINNVFVDAISGKTYPTYNPATEEEIAQVAEAGAEDVDKAVKAARKAFEIGSPWRLMDPSARGSLLTKMSDLLKRDCNNLTKLESLNNGKPFNDSFVEVYGAAKWFEYFAGWADKVTGKTIPSDSCLFTYTRREAIGVCGQIIPWNYPLMMIAWKLAPALAAGNTIVLKPADQTPLTALYVATLIKEAGFPPGVVNIVTGYGPVTGAALSNHMDVDKISFTGSTEVGRLVQIASATSNLKRVSLELGGKNPFIIFSVNDKELKKAASYAAESVFHNQGQTCYASSRVFVHEDVHDKFLEEVKNYVQKLTVGDPFDKKAKLGALVSNQQFQRVLDYIESGKSEGATLVEGGERVGTKGYFLKPTIFTDVKDDMKIAREEIFGPVMCLIKFKDLKEALKRANQTNYGLAAGVFTSDLDTVLKLVNNLQAGTVWVNCYGYVSPQAPFGGFKQSGSGRELGEDGLYEYTECKTVTIMFDDRI